MMMSFGVFLTALFIIGCGLVVLETAANPYISELGERDTAASRLNMAQSFNGLGCILAPMIVGGFLFSSSEASVALPYTIMGVCVLIVAMLFTRCNFPKSPTASLNLTTGPMPTPAYAPLYADCGPQKFPHGRIGTAML